MRILRLASLIVTATLLPIGCSSSSSTPSPADKKVNEAKEATSEAAKAKRDEFSRDVQKKLDDLDVKYKDLEQRANAAKAEDKKKLDEKIKVAKVKRDVVAKKLDELKEAPLDRWEKIKEALESAFDELKKAFE